jgi:hypothetical protein
MTMAQAFSPQVKDATSTGTDHRDGAQRRTGRLVEVEGEAEPKTIKVWLE